MGKYLSDDVITKIVVDLSAWEDHYPTGCILYNRDNMIDSAYCDEADEFIDYIDSYKDLLVPHFTNVEFIFDGYGLENTTALDCARKVWQHVHDLIHTYK